jgi:hypothetical protein
VDRHFEFTNAYAAVAAMCLMVYEKETISGLSMSSFNGKPQASLPHVAYPCGSASNEIAQCETTSIDANAFPLIIRKHAVFVERGAVQLLNKRPHLFDAKLRDFQRILRPQIFAKQLQRQVAVVPGRSQLIAVKLQIHNTVARHDSIRIFLQRCRGYGR